MKTKIFPSSFGKIFRRDTLLRRAVAMGAVFGFTLNVLANPFGMTVQSGSASLSASGSQLNITAANNTILNWQSFNIASGETTTFIQPSAGSIVWNQIGGASASQIYGSLQANGVVILLNSSGFYFGPNSFVSAAGLVVSTANCLPPQNAGGAWEFNGPPPLASIVNYGSIKVGNGGSVYLIADQVQNYGSITAPGGSIGLAAGQTVTLSERPDGRGMSMNVTLPQGSVDNYGNLVADAGTIALNAAVVNQNGLIQANSVQNQNGTIELVASDTVNLGANSQILAQGDASTGGSAGGNVTIQAGNTFSDTAGSAISTAGGANGGNGGNLEISAPNVASLNSAMDATAQSGWTGGTFFLDPVNITLGMNSSGGKINVNTAFAGFSSIQLQASGNITVANGTQWNLSSSTGQSAGQLTLQAGGNITVGTGADILDANNWSVSLAAGYNFVNHTCTTGAGSIVFNASSGIQLGLGNISLQTGNAIQLGSSSIISTAGNVSWLAGGDITFGDGSSIATTGQGSVTLDAGYNFGNSAVTTGGNKIGSAYYGNIYLNGGASGTVGGSITTAGGNVNLNAGMGISSGSGSVNTSGGNVSWLAGGDITFGDGSGISTTGQGSVTLDAGYNFLNNTVISGGNKLGTTYFGNIYLNDGSGGTGGGSITTMGGGINLTAGQSILVGSGSVTTWGGGSIFAHALSGDIDCGSDAQGYYFVPGATSIGSAYNLSQGLGGISTAAGGNVTLIAGGNVTSVLPGKNGYYYDGNFNSAQNSGYTTAGCGAYGKQAGNVTIIAGGDVTGNYLVANGIGSIYAGVLMDANGNPISNGSGGYALGTTGSAGDNQLIPNLALNLISGGWNVTAAQNICLQEVRNPNGVFNTVGSGGVTHLFDYAAGDYVHLTAGNFVQLGASSTVLPRMLNSLKVPFIYPGILTVNAGAGGVILKGDSTYNQLILFPSPQGSLIINTTDGGSLSSSLPNINGAPQLFDIVVSDSGSQQLTASDPSAFDEHADTPIHLGNPTPVELNISGDMNLVTLVSPEAAQINVVGNMNNCGFEGMNLNGSDITSITVGLSAKQKMEGLGILNPASDGGLTIGGNIYNRGAFTEVNLSTVTGSTPPDLSVLNNASGSPVSTTELMNSFSYNKTTHVLTYQAIPGYDTATVMNEMVSLGAFSSADAAAMLAAYNTLGPVPSGNPGFIIGGGGQFDIVAANMDLGTTPGIQSQGVGYYQSANGNYPLASLFTKGADINVVLTGNLTMYSSAIASLNSGNISIYTGGSISAGSPDFTVNSTSARGIFTAGQGNVTVIADGDININGSRIAAYDGGNVTVESLNGNIDAGSGGDGFVVVYDYVVDPVTRRVTSYAPTIPGSGILATTFPNDIGRAVGNILVETPNGDINASSGGIVQLPLNGVTGGSSIVEVLAGSQLQDSGGNPVYAADISAGTPVQISAGRNINADNSGVIGNTVKLDASGNIVGVIFARDNLDLTAVQNVNVTALAEGTVSANAGGTISGTIIGVGGVNASGGSIDASLESNNSVAGDTSGSKGLGQGTAANGVSQGLGNDDVAKAATKTGNDSEDDLLKKKKGIGLVQKVSRVTVLLPGKKVSERAGAGQPM